MLSRLRTALERTRGDEGITLVELLVVMALLGVVGSVTVQGIVVALASSTATQARIEATHETEIAVQRVIRDMRAASRFEISAGSDPRFELTMYTAYDGDSYKVTYSLVEQEDETQQLQQVSVRVDDDEEIGPRESILMTLVQNEVDGELAPIFLYFRFDGTPVECGPDTCLQDYVGAPEVGLSLRREVTGQQAVIVETRTAVRSMRYRSALS